MELDEQDRETKWYEIIIAIILISPVALFLWVRDKLTTETKMNAEDLKEGMNEHEITANNSNGG